MRAFVITASISMNDQSLNFINGHATPAIGNAWLNCIDPSNGEVFMQIPRSQAVDIDHAVQSARSAYEKVWQKTSAVERGRILMAISQAVTRHAEELASLEARDTGKPISQAKADANALARYFEFYAGAADKLHGQTIPYLDGYTVMTVREAHGVTGHIIPWNYPMQIFGRSVAAALAAGNCSVVKPAEDACLSLIRVAQIALEAGLPAGVLNIVCGLGTEAGAALSAHAGINHISFTGSAATGTAVAKAAAVNHVPVTLELGGKSPQVVFEDADLKAALPALVSAIIQNAGQTCSAGSRVLVQTSIYPILLEQLAERFNALRAGPSLMDLELGPLISRNQQQRVWDFLSDAQTSQLNFAAEGKVVDEAPDNGFYQAPVLLADVPSDHRLMQQEIFGPVLCVSSFEDEEQAVHIANDTPYGLVAGVWTRDGARQMRMAHKIQSGQVFINNYGAAGGVELPFGGVKHSGYGREKGFEALYAFTSLKTIAIKHG
jgi:aldehyde dehydrogenase (NAD+)